MGNCLSKRSKENPAAPSSSTEHPQELQEYIDIFKEIEDTGDIDELINMIDQLLQRTKSKQQNVSTSSQPTEEIEQESGICKSIIMKGSKFMERLNKAGSSEKLHRAIKVVAETLPQVGQINATVAGLSTIAFVLSKYEKMRDNQHECLQTLGDLMDLARHLRRLEKIIPEEEDKFTKAIQFIVQGSITCLCLSEDNRLFRFFKSSVDSEDLTNLSKRINELYPNLLLTSIVGLSENIPTYLPMTKPISPLGAVGVENQVEKIQDILGTTGQPSLAVVIYGFGGLGKTTLADAVASNINLEIYDYTRFEIYEESENNDFKSGQHQILKDCFPDYNGGQPIQLRDCTDGKSHLMEAFRSKKGKPIFLHIDNVVRSDDLEKLLPQELGELPHSSRILITTRNLAVTDTFKAQLNLLRIDYLLQPRSRGDALKILLKNPTKAETIKQEDLHRILKICSGVPLALKIVGAQLDKQRYEVDGCKNILNYLEKGDTIRQEKLSERVFDFVYDNDLEEYSREALLDICCFFNRWNRLDFEYIVGADAVTALLEAGLITSTPEYNDPNVSSHWKNIIVHDIIRVKGRFLAKDNRIFNIESLSEAEEQQRLHRIKGVWLVSNGFECGIEERHLNLMRRSLRILSLGENIKASTVSQMRFEELKFLQVSGDSPQLPLQFEKLDKLDVFYGPFFTEGEVNLCKIPKSLLSMVVVEQSHDTESHNSRMTGAPPYPSLKKLDFSDLSAMPKLPEGFSQLVCLEILILDYMADVELSEQICQLPALKILSMRGWSGLKCLPESFGRLATLTYLDLFGCFQLESLPQTFEHLTALIDLNINRCVRLKSLPTGFRQLTSLKHVECCRGLESTVKNLIGSQDEVLINDGFFSKFPERMTPRKRTIRKNIAWAWIRKLMRKLLRSQESIKTS